jgi:hypothetical protein
MIKHNKFSRSEQKRDDLQNDSGDMPSLTEIQLHQNYVKS